MTSTSSAAATGLSDRRHFLSTIAAASALGVPALPAIAAPHPDAELLRFDALLIQARALSSEAAERCDKAYEGFDPPEIPEALLWRKSDFPSVWIDKGRLDGVGDPEKGAERFTYASDGILDSMRRKASEWRAMPTIDRSFSDRCLSRVDEIIAHLEAYEAEEARQLAWCGYTAAQAAHDAHCAIVDDLAEQILAVPARTAEGVCVKLRAALMASYRDASLIGENHQFKALLAKPDRRPYETGELLSLSASIDAAQLGASSDRRAA